MNELNELVRQQAEEKINMLYKQLFTQITGEMVSPEEKKAFRVTVNEIIRLQDLIERTKDNLINLPEEEKERLEKLVSNVGVEVESDEPITYIGTYEEQFNTFKLNFLEMLDKYKASCYDNIANLKKEVAVQKKIIDTLNTMLDNEQLDNDIFEGVKKDIEHREEVIEQAGAAIIVDTKKAKLLENETMIKTLRYNFDILAQINFIFRNPLRLDDVYNLMVDKVLKDAE